MARICFVTEEVPGLAGCRGIGHALTDLAALLASGGHRVDLLCFPSREPERAARHQVEAAHRQRGVRVLWSDWRSVVTGPLTYAKRSYVVFRQLDREAPYDFIHFPDHRGLGFFCVSAKRTGRAFAETQLIVQAHRPTRWLLQRHDRFFSEQEELRCDFMERSSLVHADRVVCASAALFDWLQREHDLGAPRAEVLPPVLPPVPPSLAPEARDAAAPERLGEVVFLGALDWSDGFDVFCEAIHRIRDALSSRQVQVTFIGDWGAVSEQPAGLYLIDRSRAWKFPMRLLVGLDRAARFEYLQTCEDALVVAPGGAEATPASLVEALAMGLPLLTREDGNGTELIHPDSLQDCTTAMDPRTLSDRLLGLLEVPPSPARRAPSALRIPQRWAEIHQEPARSSPPGSKARRRPKVVLGITHYERPAKLGDAVASALAQSETELEIVVVDDGSASAAAQEALDRVEQQLAQRGGRVIVQANAYLGAARNTVLRETESDYVCFLDDDDYALPHMVATLTDAGEATQADVVACLEHRFDEAKRVQVLASPMSWSPPVAYVPLGGPLSMATLENCLGTATALLRRSTVEKVGGYSEVYGVGHEDYELYLRILQASGELVVCPAALYLREGGQKRMTIRTSIVQSFRRTFRVVDWTNRDLCGDLTSLLVGQQAQAVARLRRQEQHGRRGTGVARLRLLEDGLPMDAALLALHDIGAQDGGASMAQALARSTTPDRVLSDIRRHVAAGRLREAISALQAEVSGGGRVTDELTQLAGHALSREALAQQPAHASRLVAHIADQVASKGVFSVQAVAILPPALAMGIAEAGVLLSMVVATDSAAYLAVHHDVAEAVDRGHCQSALTHYQKHGRAEGRAGFERLSTVAEACSQLLDKTVEPWELTELVTEDGRRKGKSATKRAVRALWARLRR